MTGVVVGLDGTTSSDAALDLALLSASLTDGLLTVVYVCEPGAVRAGVDPAPAGASTRRAGLVASAAVTRAVARQPSTSGVQVRTHAQVGVPDTVLCDLATGADLMVIGACGASRNVPSLGCTARRIVERPPCPLMLVPIGPVAPITRVVTGMPTTGEAPRSLAWARRAAKRQDCELLVVTAWQQADATDAGLDTATIERTLRDRTTAMLRAGPTIDRPSQVLIRHGTAVTALRGSLRTGDLLVLGTRGRAGRFTAGLSSTSGQMVNDARWPVVLVPNQP